MYQNRPMPGTPEEVIVGLKKLIKKIEALQKEFITEITPAQIRIIFPIVKTGKGFTMQELAEFAGVDKALVSRVIADLEQKNIIERDIKSPDSNERNYSIILTSKGQDLMKNQKAKIKIIRERFLKNISPHEMILFVNTLKKLIED